MDTIDVGGASADGRPTMPAITTVDESGNAIDDGNYKTPVNKSKSEPSIRVKRAVESTPIGGAQAAYPDAHPANREDIEQTSDGGLKLTRDTETRRADLYKPLGDVRNGYVTGARSDVRNQGGTPDSSVDASLAELKESMAQLDEPKRAERVAAHNDDGKPLIEVLFHLPIGVVASYHTQVVEQDRWLIFIDDNTQPSRQKFIPDPKGTVEPITITITGSDMRQQKRKIQPLGINFTVQNYDFFVTMLVPMEEQNGEV